MNSSAELGASVYEYKKQTGEVPSGFTEHLIGDECINLFMIKPSTTTTIVQSDQTAVAVA